MNVRNSRSVLVDLARGIEAVPATFYPFFLRGFDGAEGFQ
jgi:hypothetical protein